MYICFIIGTRPEIIKISPIVRECNKRGIDYFILHSGQHYSSNMNEVFFNQLKIPTPEYNLGIKSDTHGKFTGKMLGPVEEILISEEPTDVLVEGDTNTTLAGALAASKLPTRLGHIEAGLRSYNKNMPEEINRILVDHCSDYLFPPTQRAKKNLREEGLSENEIKVTGNTIVDVVQFYSDLSPKKNILAELDLTEENYFLVTLHREGNVDKKTTFKNLLEGLRRVYQEFEMPLIYSIHPRAQKRIEEFNLSIPEGVKLISPANYLQFLRLEANATLILTDSGGVQEEACILRIPCVTLRENTERPETVKVGANIIAGTLPDSILASTKEMITKDGDWNNPLGTGEAGRAIVDFLETRQS